MPPRFRRPILALSAALAIAGLTACEKQVVAPPAVAPGHRLVSLVVTSSAFGQGGRIPIDHTCDGEDKMPPIVWSAPPEGTKSIVVYVEDLDAPTDFVHVLVYGLPESTSRLPVSAEGAGLGETGARYGANDFGNVRWNGPCPPRGEAHRYRFVVVALDKAIDAREGLIRPELEPLMNRHILGQGSLTGFFGH